MPVIRNISKDTAVDTLPKSDIFAENKEKKRLSNHQISVAKMLVSGRRFLFEQQF